MSAVFSKTGTASVFKKQNVKTAGRYKSTSEQIKNSRRKLNNSINLDNLRDNAIMGHFTTL